MATFSDKKYFGQKVVDIIGVETKPSSSRDEAVEAIARAERICTDHGVYVSTIYSFKCDECGKKICSGSKRYACQQNCNYDACEDCFQILEKTHSTIHDNNHALVVII